VKEEDLMGKRRNSHTSVIGRLFKKEVAPPCAAQEDPWQDIVDAPIGGG